MRMFGAEAREEWGEGERAEFEAYVAARTRRLRRRALWASAAFLVTVAVLSVFLAGRPMEWYWESVKQGLLLVALAEVFWLVYCWGLVFASWAAARETRREME